MFGSDGNAKYTTGSINNLYTGLETSGVAKEAKAQIDILCVVGDIACVRVVLQDWHNLSFTDLHKLIKINGKSSPRHTIRIMCRYLMYYGYHPFGVIESNLLKRSRICPTRFYKHRWQAIFLSQP